MRRSTNHYKRVSIRRFQQLNSLLPRFTRQVADHGTIEASSAPNRLSTDFFSVLAFYINKFT